MTPENFFNFINNIDFDEDSNLVSQRLKSIDSIEIQNEETILLCSFFDKYIETIDEITLSKFFEYVEFNQIHSEKVVGHILTSIFQNNFTNKKNTFLAFEFCLSWTTPNFFKNNYFSYFSSWKEQFLTIKADLPFSFIRVCLYFDDVEPILELTKKQLADKKAFPQVLLILRHWIQKSIVTNEHETSDYSHETKSILISKVIKHLAPDFYGSEFINEFKDLAEYFSIEVSRPPSTFESDSIRSNVIPFTAGGIR